MKKEGFNVSNTSINATCPSGYTLKNHDRGFTCRSTKL